MLVKKFQSLIAQSRRWLPQQECQKLTNQVNILLQIPEETNKVLTGAAASPQDHATLTSRCCRRTCWCKKCNRILLGMLQAHPFQAPEAKQPDIVVKALEGPSTPPAFNKVAILQLSRCSKCQGRNPNKIYNMRQRLSSIAEVNTALHGLIRRLSFQLDSPGGGQALHRCVHELQQFDGVELDIFTPAPWNQAVSPRFLRRLCKLYTSFDLIVDHQIPVLHYRHNVNRSPWNGELYVGDRFKCALDQVVQDIAGQLLSCRKTCPRTEREVLQCQLGGFLHVLLRVTVLPVLQYMQVQKRFLCREYPEGTGLPPPKYASAADWLHHLILPACKAGGPKQSFINTLHADPSGIHWSPQNTLHPIRVCCHHLPCLSSAKLQSTCPATANLCRNRQHALLFPRKSTSSG